MPITALRTGSPNITSIIQDPTRLNIPFEHVTLKEFHKGSNGKLIIHIQDAHANFSGQMSLANALDHFMREYGFSLVLSEGSAKDSTLDDIKQVASSKDWKKVAKRLLMEGIIKGEEYVNLTTDHPIKIMGIEYKDLYDKGLQAYADLTDQRKKILLYIHTIRTSLRCLKNKHYTKELLDYEDSVIANETRVATEKTSNLLRLASHAVIPLAAAYPETFKLQTLQQKEKNIDFVLANHEQSELLRNLSSKSEEARLKVQTFIRTSKKTKNLHVTQFALFNNIFSMAQERGILTDSYPTLIQYQAYLRDFSSLKMDILLDELDRLEDNVYKNLLAEEAARKIRSIDRFINLLEKAYKIQMSSDEFDMLLANEDDFGTQRWQAFLNEALRQLEYYDALVPYKPYLETAKAYLHDFYASVDERDLAFLENTDRIMAEQERDIAFLIAGGYHTDHITQLLRDSGSSYIVLTPIVTMETDHEKYEDRLLADLNIKKRKAHIEDVYDSKRATHGNESDHTFREELFTSSPSGIDNFLQVAKALFSQDKFIPLQKVMRRFEENIDNGFNDRDNIGRQYPSSSRYQTPTAEPVVSGVVTQKESGTRVTWTEFAEAAHFAGLSGYDNVTNLTISKTGRYIAMLSSRASDMLALKIFDTKKKEYLAEFKWDEQSLLKELHAQNLLGQDSRTTTQVYSHPTGVTFSNDDRLVVILYSFGPAHVFDIETGQELPYEIGVNSISAQRRNKLSKEYAHNKEVLDKKLRESQGVYHVEFSPDGNLFLVIYTNRSVKVFNVSSRDQLPLKDIKWVDEAYFSSDSQTLHVHYRYEKPEVQKISLVEADAAKKRSKVDTPSDRSALVGPTAREDRRRSFISPNGKFKVKIDFENYLPYGSYTVTDLETNKSRVLFLQADETPKNSTTSVIRTVHVSNNGDWVIFLFMDRDSYPRIVNTKQNIDLSSTVGHIQTAEISTDGTKMFMRYPLPSSVRGRGMKQDQRFSEIKFFDLIDRSFINLPMGYMEPHQGQDRWSGPSPQVRDAKFIQDTNIVCVHLHDGSVSLLDLDVYASNPDLTALSEQWGDHFYDGLRAMNLLFQSNVIQTNEDLDYWLSFFMGKVEPDPVHLRNAFKLVRLHLRDGGNAESTYGLIPVLALMRSSKFVPSGLPVVPPVYPDIKNSGIPIKGKLPINRFMKDATLFKVLGRTLIFKTSEGKYVAFKFLRQGEDPGRLVYESTFFKYLNDLKRLGINLGSDYPEPYLVDGLPVLRVKPDTLPDEIIKALPPNVVLARNHFMFMAYQTSTEQYFEYIHELDDASESAEQSIHDLFLLLRYGLVHPDLVDLFHNLMQGGRPDAGKYIWDVDVVRPMKTRSGAGRIHAWQNAAQYPNLSSAGFRDPAEMTSFGTLSRNLQRNEHSSYLWNNLQRFKEGPRDSFLLTHFMGNYFMSWTLTEGRRLRRLGRLQWDNNDHIHSLAKSAQRVYESAYQGFTGSAAGDLVDIIDWDRFARQMAFFMGDAYKSYGGQQIPQSIYGMDVTIRAGESWGYIHRDEIRRRLGVKDDEMSGILHSHFVPAVSSRRASPDDIYVFKPDADIQSARKEMQELYDEYAHGWRFDGIHEDLGPVNGPLPLQEMIRANYVFTMLMINERLSSTQISSSREGDDVTDKKRADGARLSMRWKSALATNAEKEYYQYVAPYVFGIDVLISRIRNTSTSTLYSSIFNQVYDSRYPDTSVSGVT